MVPLKKFKMGSPRKESSVRHAGHLLPPRGTRAGGEHLKLEAYSLESARLEAARLVQTCGLSETGVNLYFVRT